MCTLHTYMGTAHRGSKYRSRWRLRWRLGWCCKTLGAAPFFHFLTKCSVCSSKDNGCWENNITSVCRVPWRYDGFLWFLVNTGTSLGHMGLKSGSRDSLMFLKNCLHKRAKKGLVPWWYLITLTRILENLDFIWLGLVLKKSPAYDHSRRVLIAYCIHWIVTVNPGSPICYLLVGFEFPTKAKILNHFHSYSSFRYSPSIWKTFVLNGNHHCFPHFFVRKG